MTQCYPTVAPLLILQIPQSYTESPIYGNIVLLMCEVNQLRQQWDYFPLVSAACRVPIQASIAENSSVQCVASP